jgi:lipopolysaccharide/colanic/teichoic acid biosynthesis glycosyltransferase
LRRRRSALAIDDSGAHDLEYLRRYRFFLDPKVVFLTVLGCRVHQNAF